MPSEMHLLPTCLQCLSHFCMFVHLLHCLSLLFSPLNCLSPTGTQTVGGSGTRVLALFTFRKSRTVSGTGQSVRTHDFKPRTCASGRAAGILPHLLSAESGHLKTPVYTGVLLSRAVFSVTSEASTSTLLSPRECPYQNSTHLWCQVKNWPTVFL